MTEAENIEFCSGISRHQKKNEKTYGEVFN
jgi:hypothetical protein